MKYVTAFILPILLMSSPASANETIWLHCNPDGNGIPSDRAYGSKNIEITKNLELLKTPWGDYKLTDRAVGKYTPAMKDTVDSHAYFKVYNMSFSVFFGMNGKRKEHISHFCFPIINPFEQ